MTGLEELKWLAGVLDDYIAVPLAPPGYYPEGIIPAAKAAILSLIERVKMTEAEGYQRGMEDAATVARSFDKSIMSMTREDVLACEIAQAIREKAKASAVVWQNPTSWSRESTDGVLYIERMAGQKSPWKAFMAGELIGQGKTEDEAKALCQKAKAGKQGEG
jgi:hypothetical protein